MVKRHLKVPSYKFTRYNNIKNGKLSKEILNIQVINAITQTFGIFQDNIKLLRLHLNAP